MFIIVDYSLFGTQKKSKQSLSIETPYFDKASVLLTEIFYFNGFTIVRNFIVDI